MRSISKAVVLAIMVLFTLACGQSSSHPTGIVKRVSTLGSTIVRLENDCQSAKSRFCGLDELPFSEMSRWGDIRVESPTRATFEEFDLQLLLKKDRYCLAAFPTRLPDSILAVWKDDKGTRYLTRYPWREVPKPCEFPNRAKLLVE